MIDTCVKNDNNLSDRSQDMAVQNPYTVQNVNQCVRVIDHGHHSITFALQERIQTHVTSIYKYYAPQAFVGLDNEDFRTFYTAL